jgi:alkylation response protein AidB-like acyl-CoA dehydrogenase
LADELLFPTALATDAGERVPPGHLDALADAGLYGLYGPAAAGGLDADALTGLRVVEILAGGCLTTAFVWIQHQPTVRAVAASTTPGMREEWLEPLCRGQRRAGIAVAGIRPSAAAVTARPAPGGWLVNGEVPWVTGWGMVDVLRLAARCEGGEVLWALVDAVESPTLTCRRSRLMAVDASVTVVVQFRDHFVPAERVTEVEAYDRWLAHDARGLRGNGSLALGVAGRCCRMMGPGLLDEELEACRAALDRAAGLVPGNDGAGSAESADPAGADPDALAAARARASELAARAAAALAVSTGSRAVLRDQHPQRLAREAAFLLVFASRPSIRNELLKRILRGV